MRGFCCRCRYRRTGNYCQVCGGCLIDLGDLSQWDMRCKCCCRVYPWHKYCDKCGEPITADHIMLYLEERGGKIIEGFTI